MTLMTTEELAGMFGDRPMHPDRPRGSIERARRRGASVSIVSPGDPYTSLPAGMLEPGAERIWPGYGPPMARRLEVERAVREGTNGLAVTTVTIWTENHGWLKRCFIGF